MSMRTASPTAGRQTSEVRGSLLDTRRPPTLPTGLKPRVRKRAREIFEHNPHLWDPSQVDPVVRLATYRVEIEDMSEAIYDNGYWEDTAAGTRKLSPLLQARDAASRVALSIDRQLGITFQARNVNVKKAELEKPAQPKAAGKPTQGRVLKLA